MTGEKVNQIVVDALNAAGLSGSDEVYIERAQIAGDGTHDEVIDGIEFDEEGKYRITLQALGSLCPDMFKPQFMSPDALRVWVEISNPENR